MIRLPLDLDKRVFKSRRMPFNIHAKPDSQHSLGPELLQREVQPMECFCSHPVIQGVDWAQVSCICP